MADAAVSGPPFQVLAAPMGGGDWIVKAGHAAIGGALLCATEGARCVPLFSGTVQAAMETAESAVEASCAAPFFIGQI